MVDDALEVPVTEGLGCPKCGGARFDVFYDISASVTVDVNAATVVNVAVDNDAAQRNHVVCANPACRWSNDSENQGALGELNAAVLQAVGQPRPANEATPDGVVLLERAGLIADSADWPETVDVWW